MRKKSEQKAQALPVVEVQEVQRRLFIVTDRIQGFVGKRHISHVRGDKVYLSDDEANVFKDSILEI